MADEVLLSGEEGLWSDEDAEPAEPAPELLAFPPVAVIGAEAREGRATPLQPAGRRAPRRGPSPDGTAGPDTGSHLGAE